MTRNQPAVWAMGIHRMRGARVSRIHCRGTCRRDTRRVPLDR